MKRFSFLLLTCFLSFSFLAKAQLPDWTRVIQGNTTGIQEINAITTDANNVYVAARFSDKISIAGQNYTSKGDYDLLIVKTTNAGVVSWVKQVELNGGASKADAIAVDSTGGVYVTATYSGTINFNTTTITSDETNNSFIAKFDSNGDGVWIKPFLNTDIGISEIALDDSKNVYLVSKTSKFIKFSSTGDILWTQSYPVGYLYGIAIGGTNLYLSGIVKSTTIMGTIEISEINGSYAGFLLKADLDGNYVDSVILRNNVYGASINDVVIDKDGNLLITGFYSSELKLRNLSIANDTKEKRTYIAKCDPNFSFSWVKTSTKILNYYSLLPAYNEYRIYVDNSNGIYQYGTVSSTFNFGTVAVNSLEAQYLVKFDSNGDAISSIKLNDTYLTRLAISRKGKVILAKNTNDFGNTKYGNIYLTLSDNNLAKEWQSVYESTSPGLLRILNIQHDNAYNLYVKASVSGNVDFFGTTLNVDTLSTIIAKLDVYGHVVWHRIIEDQAPQTFGSTFILDKDNNAITIGLFKTSLTIEDQTINTTNAEYEGYAAKFSSAGNLVWAKPFELGVDISKTINVTADNDGNVILTGTVNPDNFLIKLNSAGEKLWSKTFPMESRYNSIVSVDNNGSIYMASEVHLEWGTGSAVIGDITLNQSADDGSTVIVKFDHNGNTIWAKTYGGKTGDSWTDGWPCYIKNDANGNTYVWSVMQDGAVLGTTTIDNPYNYEYSLCLFKLNSTGDVLWAKPIYEKVYGFNYGRKLDFDSNGNIYVSADYKDVISIEGTEYVPQSICDNFIAKYSSEGELLGVKTLPFPTTSGIEAISIAPNNALAIGGASTSSSTLGNATINKKSGSNCMIATLGNAYFLNVTPNELTMGATQGSTADINITSNIDWTVSNTTSWISLNKSAGQGNQSITITAEENPTSSTRTATITISAVGVDDKVVTLTQSAPSVFLTLSTQSIAISAAEGSTNTFNISSNTSWTVASNQTWLTASTANGTGNGTITITANANPNTTTRTATITVSATGVETRIITVTQDAAATYLSVSTQTISIAASEGSNSTFEISSNTSWTIACNQTWLTANAANGTGNGTITITANTNPNTTNRTATITVAATGVENKVITVTQNAATSYLTVSTQTISIAASEGSNGSFEISSNTAWTIASNQTWLTANATNGTGNGTITLTANKNPNTTTRTATITISATGIENKVVNITQDALPNSISSDITENDLLFPNPAENFIKIKNFEPGIAITIWDSNGMLVLTKNLQDNSVNISQLTRGLYFIRIVNKNKEYTSKFVKH